MDKNDKNKTGIKESKEKECSKRISRSDRQQFRNMEEEICETLKASTGILTKKTHMILGLSGGADSVFLYTILKKYYKKHIEDNHVVLHVMHLNHNIRGKEALRDEKFVEEIAKKDKVISHIYSENVVEDAKKESESVETYARKRRYILLDQIASEIEKQEPETDIYILTAHNAGDNAETIFMNIFRGAGKSGLMGLSAKTKLSEYARHTILRPIINIIKKDILKYLDAHEIKYVEDSSNAKNEYTRNKIRNVVFPYLEEEMGYNPSKTLVRMSKLMKEEEKYIKRTVKEALKRSIIYADKKTLCIDPDVVLKEDPYIAKRVILNGIILLLNSSKNITYTNVEEIYKLMGEKIVGKKLYPTKEVSVSIEKNGKNKACVIRV